jgi:enamine deaminase RidA (YjgF/YER057c/UK114 family)
MERINISSGAVWEDIAGYSRAVRLGNTIEVSGTTAVSGSEIMGVGNPYEQARLALQKIEKALEDAGAGMKDVVRTRMYVTDISAWEEVARAHGEVFAAIRPASTMVEVSRLIHPDLLVEIEVSAITGG